MKSTGFGKSHPDVPRLDTLEGTFHDELDGKMKPASAWWDARRADSRPTGYVESTDTPLSEAETPLSTERSSVLEIPDSLYAKREMLDSLYRDTESGKELDVEKVIELNLKLKGVGSSLLHLSAACARFSVLSDLNAHSDELKARGYDLSVEVNTRDCNDKTPLDLSASLTREDFSAPVMRSDFVTEEQEELLQLAKDRNGIKVPKGKTAKGLCSELGVAYQQVDKFKLFQTQAGDLWKSEPARAADQLLKLGANPLLASPADGHTVAHEAAMHDNIFVLHRLAYENTECFSVANGEGKRPIEVAPEHSLAYSRLSDWDMRCDRWGKLREKCERVQGPRIVESSLEQWLDTHRAESNYEQYEEAVIRIRAAYFDEEKKLDLSDLDIKVLPSCIDKLGKTKRVILPPCTAQPGQIPDGMRIEGPFEFQNQLFGWMHTHISHGDFVSHLLNAYYGEEGLDLNRFPGLEVPECFPAKRLERLYAEQEQRQLQKMQADIATALVTQAAASVLLINALQELAAAMADVAVIPQKAVWEFEAPLPQPEPVVIEAGQDIHVVHQALTARSSSWSEAVGEKVHRTPMSNGGSFVEASFRPERNQGGFLCCGC